MTYKFQLSKIKAGRYAVGLRVSEKTLMKLEQLVDKYKTTKTRIVSEIIEDVIEQIN